VSYLTAATAVARPTFTQAEARRLTDQVERDLATVWRRLVELHDGGAHFVLGYSSWHAYCGKEFGFGRSQSHRLLAAGRVAAVIPQLGNEAHARELFPLLRDVGEQAVIDLVENVRTKHGERLTAALLRAAVAQQTIVRARPEADSAPDPPKHPDSQAGDLYELGPHRLICGDATDPAVLAALFGDERAAMIWTDPPYGVDYVGKTENALRIQNDGPEGLRELLIGAWRAAQPLLIESAPFYVAGPTGPRGEDFQASFREAEWVFKQMLVWLKPQIVLGRQNYHLQYEGIYHGHAPGRNAGRMTPDRFRWHGPDNETSVFEVASPRASEEHPTMKPIAVITPALKNSSLPGEIVLDLFAGSGSTLLAAHQAGRRAYLVELDPRYCDVIRARWASVEVAPSADDAQAA
jgi:DNA modification methylase